jgi:Ca2+-binding EF-hand superfamily protein
LLDRGRKGKINDVALRQALKDKDFLINVRDAQNLIQKFDRNQDCMIDLGEFVKEFRRKSQAVYFDQTE